MITGRKIQLVSMDQLDSLAYSSNRENPVHIFPRNRRFSVILLATQEIIGEVNYCGFSPEDRKVEIGMEIRQDMRRQGYGEDALYHFLEFLFRAMLVNAVMLALFCDNLPAHRLYLKLGFTQKEIQLKGGYDAERQDFFDIIIMELTRKKWQIVRTSQVW